MVLRHRACEYRLDIARRDFGRDETTALAAMRPAMLMRPMDIFISYSSKYRDLRERLQLALDAEGHHCFVDRTELEPGQPFDAELREAIAECDVFIFLVSPESVAAGSYALAELNLAQQRWRHPRGRVLAGGRRTDAMASSRRI